MRKTTQHIIDNNTVTTNTTGLMQVLNCGRSTAVKIGMEAQAKLTVGKRVLWHLPKIYKYLEKTAVGE